MFNAVIAGQTDVISWSLLCVIHIVVVFWTVIVCVCSVVLMVRLRWWNCCWTMQPMSMHVTVSCGRPFMLLPRVVTWTSALCLSPSACSLLCFVHRAVMRCSASPEPGGRCAGCALPVVVPDWSQYSEFFTVVWQEAHLATVPLDPTSCFSVTIMEEDWGWIDLGWLTLLHWMFSCYWLIARTSGLCPFAAHYA